MNERPHRARDVAGADAPGLPGPQGNGGSRGNQGNTDSPARDAEHALWGLWRLWKQRSRSACGKKRTFEQHFLLRRIAERRSMTVSELADELGITPGAATIATRRLEKAGLLRKERSESDQRLVMLSLTPDGRASLDELDAIRLSILAELLNPLSPGERTALASLIQKVTRAAGQEGEVPVRGKDD